MINAPYLDLLRWFACATAGLSTMVDEHFGISLVELMVNLALHRLNAQTESDVAARLGCRCHTDSPPLSRPTLGHRGAF